MIHRGPAFPAGSQYSAPRPPPPPSPLQQVVTFSQSSCACVAGRASDGWGGGRVGEELNHTIARKPGLL